MKKLLITGATGNVGREVIKALLQRKNSGYTVIAAMRKVEQGKKSFPATDIEFREFDFEDERTFGQAFESCTVLFLLRPPQITDVKRVFLPLIRKAKDCRIGHIVFLSVQGVENSSFIPHHKIEKLIVESGIPYTFMRPAYFMQNFTTTLREDLVKRNLIFLPAGKAKFTLIDVVDIGEATARVMPEPESHINRSYELTNNEKWDFGEMVGLISAVTGKDIRYISPGIISFFIRKKKQGMSTGFILVMIMLHYFPRFQKEPPITKCFQKLTGRSPRSFEEFVRENQVSFIAKV
jgi:uncharacterized protein YbjT (DUF2867 family)